MDKQEEIRTLQSLKGETYFNQFFSNEDIDRMCQNITNDFAIEYGCKFHSKEELLTKALSEIRGKQTEFNKIIAYRLIDICMGDTAVFDSVLMDLTSRLSIIKYKREQGFSLSDEEIDYLINEAGK